MTHKEEVRSLQVRYCNTVESLNYHRTNQGQGWIGIRFQRALGEEHNDVVLHVNMHDNNNRSQQIALGILGFIISGINIFLNTKYYYEEEKYPKGYIGMLLSSLPVLFMLFVIMKHRH